MSKIHNNIYTTIIRSNQNTNMIGEYYLKCRGFRSQGSWEISSREGKTCQQGWNNVKASLIIKNILILAHKDSRQRQDKWSIWDKKIKEKKEAPHLHQIKNCSAGATVEGEESWTTKFNTCERQQLMYRNRKAACKSHSQRRDWTACSNSYAADLLLSKQH